MLWVVHVHAGKSVLSVGTFDLNKCAISEFTYIDRVMKSPLWMVRRDHFYYGNSHFPKSRNALISTADEFISLSKTAYTQVKTTICALTPCTNSTEYITFPCPNNEEKALPDMIFTMQGHNFTITPKHYIHKSGELCHAMVMMTTGKLDYLGYPFLRAYYTVFDAEKDHIGFAVSLNNDPPSLLDIVRPVLEYLVLLFVLVAFGCTLRHL